MTATDKHNQVTRRTCSVPNLYEAKHKLSSNKNPSNTCTFLLVFHSRSWKFKTDTLSSKGTLCT